MACIASETKSGHRRLAFGLPLRSLVLRADCRTSHSVTTLMNSLAVMTSLHNLALSMVVANLCQKSANSLCSVLKSLPIHHLDLRARCTLDSSQPLIETLGNCQTLRTLRLTLTHGRQWRGVRSLSSFQQPLSGQMHTLALDFNRGWVCGSDLKHKFMCDSSMAATQLTSLSLTRLRIDCEGAMALASRLTALKSLTTLTLHLSHSRVTRHGAAALGSIGVHLDCLQCYDLDLSAGNLTDASVDNLCTSLSLKSSLDLKLNVGHNNIGPLGAKALAKLSVPRLHVCIAYNPRMTDDGVRALVPLTTKKHSNVTIVLDGNRMSQSALHSLFEGRHQLVPLGPLSIRAHSVGCGYDDSTHDVVLRCHSWTSLQLQYVTYCSQNEAAGREIPSQFHPKKNQTTSVCMPI